MQPTRGLTSSSGLECPVEAAKSRKEVRYHELVESINLTHNWKAQLLTIEVGARGLIGGSTFRAFLKLGFSLQGARNLTKTLSTVVARCSYAVYLAHKSHAWSHNSDLVIAETASGSDVTEKRQTVLLPPPQKTKQATSKERSHTSRFTVSVVVS